jgi:3-carboxy-cis,cis-muconate cycloisomerase
MPPRLIDGLVSTPAAADAFGDRALVGAMLRFEGALARAQASCGVIPADAAVVIDQVARQVTFDAETLAAGFRRHASLAIPVVEALTRAVEAKSADAAKYVHWGATSQDVYDTALILCLREAWASIAADGQRLLGSLAAMSDRHAGTVMLARTLLQPALPTTFGLKVARWYGAVARTWRTLSEAFDAAQVLQFGGAAGTLASFGGRAGAVEAALAAELDLRVPDAPWHTERDRFVTLVAAAGACVAALAKIARDVSLLMQWEVGEVAETGGGSSAMPHKRNPAGSTVVLACAQRMPGLVSTMLQAAVQEHERAAGGWQAEAPTLADALETLGSAMAAAVALVDGLTVDEARMRKNLDATGGVVLAERVGLAAAASLGRARAAALVRQAVEAAVSTGRPLRATVAELPELAAALEGIDQDVLFDVTASVGAADLFRKRLLTGEPAGTRED